MNPIMALLIGAGYGFLSGNPTARKQFFSTVQQVAGKSIDALNGKGGDSNVQPNEQSD